MPPDTYRQPQFSSGLSPSATRSAVRSRWVAEQHFFYEATNEMDRILLSMRSDGPITTSVIRWDGPERTPRVTWAKNPEEQRAFYVENRKTSHITGAEIFTSFGTDWYGFIHGMISSTFKPTGKPRMSEGVGILPAVKTQDTIRGEIAFGRAVPSAEEEPPALAIDKRLQGLRVQAARLEALQARDFNKLGALFTNKAIGAVRTYSADGQASDAQQPLSGADAIVAFYRGLFDAFPGLQVDQVLRMGESWFTLTELVWEGKGSDGRVIRFKTADLTTLDKDGKIEVQIGWGSDPETITA